MKIVTLPAKCLTTMRLNYSIEFHLEFRNTGVNSINIGLWKTAKAKRKTGSMSINFEMESNWEIVNLHKVVYTFCDIIRTHE